MHKPGDGDEHQHQQRDGGAAAVLLMQAQQQRERNGGAPEEHHQPAEDGDHAQQLLQPSSLHMNVRSGLLLSGIRRVGKTTFLRQDLVPALEARGALVIYVDGTPVGVPCDLLDFKKSCRTITTLVNDNGSALDGVPCQGADGLWRMSDEPVLV